jgi:hypothetical protein
LLQRRHGEADVRITTGSKDGYSRGAWKDLLENLETFSVCFMGRFKGYTSHITAGARITRYKSSSTGKEIDMKTTGRLLTNFLAIAPLTVPQTTSKSMPGSNAFMVASKLSDCGTVY